MPDPRLSAFPLIEANQGLIGLIGGAVAVAGLWTAIKIAEEERVRAERDRKRALLEEARADAADRRAAEADTRAEQARIWADHQRLASFVAAAARLIDGSINAGSLAASEMDTMRPGGVKYYTVSELQAQVEEDGAALEAMLPSQPPNGPIAVSLNRIRRQLTFIETADFWAFHGRLMTVAERIRSEINKLVELRQAMFDELAEDERRVRERHGLA